MKGVRKFWVIEGRIEQNGDITVTCYSSYNAKRNKKRLVMVNVWRFAKNGIAYKIFEEKLKKYASNSFVYSEVLT